jgi:hypothetical protein
MTLRILALSLSSLVLVGAISHPVIAQAPPITAPGASIEVRIAMEEQQVTLGQSPIVVLTVWNITDRVVYWYTSGYRIHLEGKNGEPPNTTYYHRFLGDPGFSPLNSTNNAEPGSLLLYPVDMGANSNSADRKLTLSQFYNLDAIGPYSVYLEVLDGSFLGYGAENLLSLTTNTVSFNIQAVANSDSTKEPNKP